MEIRTLKTFLEVAERKSFTKAAEALGYTQSAVSAQIKQLESELDVQLFERIHHNVMLTERGTALLSYAYQIVNLTEELRITSAESNLEGTVRFAMAPSICSVLMGKTYMTFHHLYPHVTVKILEAETDRMLQLLNQNDADLVFIVDRHTYNKDYVIVSEKREEMHFIADRDFPLAKQKSLTVEDLLAYPFVLTEKGLSYRKLFDEALAERHIEISPLVEIGNTSLLLELIELGAGISYLPEYVTKQAHSEGRIVYLDVKDFEIEIWRQLLYHKNKWVSPSMRAVIDYCSKASENL